MKKRILPVLGVIILFMTVGCAEQEQRQHTVITEPDLSTPGFIIDLVGSLVTRMQDVEIIESMRTDFRIGRRGFRRRPTFADDQFPFIDEKTLLGENIFERRGSLNGHGSILIPIRLIEIRQENSAFSRNAGLRPDTLLAKGGDSGQHDLSPIRKRNIRRPDSDSARLVRFS